MNRQLGTKWFTFYTKVRPWLSCLAVFSVVNDFVQYTDVYISNWWMMIYFLAAIAQTILSVMVAVKSGGDYVDFVRFVKGVLLFETIGIAYQQGLQQYIDSGFDIAIALVIFAIIFVIGYFLWYRLNVKYFEKRIFTASVVGEGILTTFPQGPFVNNSTDIASQAGKVCFCRKCGERLADSDRFCSKCGAEVLEVQ